MIGGAPGGGYDRYGRTFARHIGKYITGNPSLVPRNRPGAGGRKAVSWMVAKAPRDGRVFGIVFPGAIDPISGGPGGEARGRALQRAARGDQQHHQGNRHEAEEKEKNVERVFQRMPAPGLRIGGFFFYGRSRGACRMTPIGNFWGMK